MLSPTCVMKDRGWREIMMVVKVMRPVFLLWMMCCSLIGRLQDGVMMSTG
jgi:hypothetical protein